MTPEQAHDAQQILGMYFCEIEEGMATYRACVAPKLEGASPSKLSAFHHDDIKELQRNGLPLAVLCDAGVLYVGFKPGRKEEEILSKNSDIATLVGRDDALGQNIYRITKSGEESFKAIEAAAQPQGHISAARARIIDPTAIAYIDEGAISSKAEAYKPGPRKR